MSLPRLEVWAALSFGSVSARGGALQFTVPLLAIAALVAPGLNTLISRKFAPREYGCIG